MPPFSPPPPYPPYSYTVKTTAILKNSSLNATVNHIFGSINDFYNTSNVNTRVVETYQLQYEITDNLDVEKVRVKVEESACSGYLFCNVSISSSIETSKRRLSTTFTFDIVRDLVPSSTILQYSPIEISIGNTSFSSTPINTVTTLLVEATTQGTHEQSVDSVLYGESYFASTIGQTLGISISQVSTSSVTPPLPPPSLPPSPPPHPSQPPSLPHPSPAGFTCNNLCVGYSDYDYAEDGQYGLASNSQCDDGGPGSSQSVCALGTDCADCGVRYISSPPPLLSPSLPSYPSFPAPESPESPESPQPEPPPPSPFPSPPSPQSPPPSSMSLATSPPNSPINYEEFLLYLFISLAVVITITSTIIVIITANYLRKPSSGQQIRQMGLTNRVQPSETEIDSTFIQTPKLVFKESTKSREVPNTIKRIRSEQERNRTKNLGTTNYSTLPIRSKSSIPRRQSENTEVYESEPAPVVTSKVNPNALPDNKPPIQSKSSIRQSENTKVYENNPSPAETPKVNPAGDDIPKLSKSNILKKDLETTKTKQNDSSESSQSSSNNINTRDNNLTVNRSSTPLPISVNSGRILNKKLKRPNI